MAERRTVAYVLVVEDDVDFREVLRETLTWAGHTSSIVRDVRTARQALRERPPDVILLDLHFVNGDNGLTFAEEIRATSAVPIVACSGHPEYLEVALTSTTFTKVLTKPCDVVDVVRAITALAPT